MVQGIAGILGVICAKWDARLLGRGWPDTNGIVHDASPHCFVVGPFPDCRVWLATLASYRAVDPRVTTFASAASHPWLTLHSATDSKCRYPALKRFGRWEVYQCDFGDLLPPEMVKIRPIIVVSRSRLTSAGSTILVVSVSSTPSEVQALQHLKLATNVSPWKPTPVVS